MSWDGCLRWIISGTDRRGPINGQPLSSAHRIGAKAQPKDIETQTLPLTVPKDTPVQVVLDHEVRLKQVGQPLRGRVVEPVYAFDKLVIPEGSIVTGQVIKMIL